jgi:hypothetical protein
MSYYEGGYDVAYVVRMGQVLEGHAHHLVPLHGGPTAVACLGQCRKPEKKQAIQEQASETQYLLQLLQQVHEKLMSLAPVSGAARAVIACVASSLVPWS